MKRRQMYVLAVAILAVAISACGGGGASTEIDVETKEFAFSPTSWEVAAGEEITVNLKNEGAVLHEWVIVKPGSEITSEDQFTEDVVLWEAEAEAGESLTAAMDALEAGEYQIICAIEAHFEAGMKGTLTATDG